MRPRDEEQFQQQGLDFAREHDESKAEMLRPGAKDAMGAHADSGQSRLLDDLDTIDALREVALDCRRCHLRATCKGVVFGEGKPDADLVFVGEAPGADEDRLGRPFVGRAGKLLDRIIAAAGLQRNLVYITNIVKCRPPENRTPSEFERDRCMPYLRTQMRLIRPKILVSMGAAATQGLIDADARITRMRGTWQEWNGIRVMPTFHPAALLRDPRKKAPVWEDIKMVLEAAGYEVPS